MRYSTALFRAAAKAGIQPTSRPEISPADTPTYQILDIKKPGQVCPFFSDSTSSPVALTPTPTLPLLPQPLPELASLLYLLAISEVSAQHRDEVLPTTDELAAAQAELQLAAQSSSPPGQLNYDEWIELKSKLPASMQSWMKANTFLGLQRNHAERVHVSTISRYWVTRSHISCVGTDLANLDRDGDGMLDEPDIEDFIFNCCEQQPGFIRPDFLQFYVYHAARKFLRHLDVRGSGRISVHAVLSSALLMEFLQVLYHDPTAASEPGTSPDSSVYTTSWFAPGEAHAVYNDYIALNLRGTGLLNLGELRGCTAGQFTVPFLQQVFQAVRTYSGELDYKGYLDFILAMKYRSHMYSMKVCAREHA